MKKISIIFISVLFLVSVFVVGIYGHKLIVDNISIYIAKIECKYLLLNDRTVHLEYSEISDSYVIHEYDNITDSYINFIQYYENMEIGLYYDVYPDNSTTKAVEFSLSNYSYANITDQNTIKLKTLTDESLENTNWIYFDLYVNALDSGGVHSTVNLLFKSY